MKLDLTEQEIKLTLTALAELPFKHVCSIIPNIQTQCKEQAEIAEEEK